MTLGTTLPISDFQGVISGARFTQEMFDCVSRDQPLYAGFENNEA